MFNALKQNKQELLFIFTTALVFRFAWFLTVFFINPDGFYFFDSHGYLELGQNILSKAEFGRFSDGYFYKEHFRTPGYPLLISFFLALFKDLLPLVLFQVLCAALIPVLLYLITIRLEFSRKTALIASFLMVIDLPSILFASTILSETFFVFAFLLSVWLILLARKKSSYTFFVLSALTISFAILIRPIAIFLPFVIILLIRFEIN